MDRLLLIASTFCYLFAVVRTALLLRALSFAPGRSNFFAIVAGFALQTAFLGVRGHALGRCPLTNLFEVFIFMAWSVALIYLLVGPTYRLSLMGAFTAPLVLLMQTAALLAPIDRSPHHQMTVNPWLELHASVSIVAYGAFALACIAGLMYLLQERQLKTHQLHSVFHHLPPLTELYAAIVRLLWLGFGLYTAGLLSGFFTGEPLPVVKMLCAILVWVFYGAILQGRHLFRLAPRQVAMLCVIAFSAAVSVLWGITFVAQRGPV
ncbi:MAG: cytochrome C assembly family protein [Chthoniobacterales bacterium]